MRSKLLFLGLVAAVLFGCGKVDDTTAEGYPVIRTPEEAETLEAKAQQLTATIFAKLDDKQPLTDADRNNLREAARITEGQALYDPLAFGPFWRLGQIYVAIGEYDKAIDRLNTFLRLMPGTDVQLAPRVADAKYLIAQAHAGKEDYSTAAAELDAILTAYPDTPEFLLLRAQCLIKLDRKQDAKRDLIKLLVKHPEAAAAKLLLTELNRGAKSEG